MKARTLGLPTHTLGNSKMELTSNKFRRHFIIGWLMIVLSALLNPASASEEGDEKECGSYDHRPALELKNEYLAALKARDYERLKELKAKKEGIDLWAKTQVECVSTQGQQDGSGDQNQETDETESEEKCPEILVSNMPSNVCVGETSQVSISTNPKDKPINIKVSPSGLQLVEAGSGYELRPTSAAIEPFSIEVSHKSCSAQTFELTVAPKVVNDLWNFPLVGDPDASDVNDAYDYLTDFCPSSGQNPINHSIDGCSGPAPQRLTEAGGISMLQFERFDKFRPGFEPVWGQARPGGLPSGSSDTLACNNHDICYQTCGETQAGCDARLRADIVDSCNVAYPNPCPFTDGNFLTNRLRCQDYNSERTDCRDIAAWFERGLSIPGNFGGRPAFRTRQVQYCKCCD